MTLPSLFLILAIVFVLIEAVTPGFFALSIGASFLILSLISFFTALPAVLITCFSVGLILFFILLRWLMPKLDKKKEIRTGVEALIGRKVLVSETINNLTDTGRVLIDSVDWRARSGEPDKIIEKGCEVKIVKVEGVTVIIG